MNEAAAIADLLLMLLAHPRTGVLIALLLVAAVIDWRTYRIPNWLTVGGMVYGLACNAVLAPSALTGTLDAFAGLALGLVMLLPMYLVRVMGAGDVKLMAMAGAFLGMAGVLHALLWTVIAGGIAALLFAVARRSAGRLATHVGDAAHAMAWAMVTGERATPSLIHRASIGRLPYAVAIAGGTVGWLFARQFGLA